MLYQLSYTGVSGAGRAVVLSAEHSECSISGAPGLTGRACLAGCRQVLNAGCVELRVAGFVPRKGYLVTHMFGQIGCAPDGRFDSAGLVGNLISAGALALGETTG